MALVDILGEITRRVVQVEPRVSSEELKRRNQEEMNHLTDRQCELVRIEKKTPEDLKELAPMNDHYLELINRPLLQKTDLVFLNFIRIPFRTNKIRP